MPFDDAPAWWPDEPEDGDGDENTDDQFAAALLLTFIRHAELGGVSFGKITAFRAMTALGRLTHQAPEYLRAVADGDE